MITLHVMAGFDKEKARLHLPAEQASWYLLTVI